MLGCGGGVGGKGSLDGDQGQEYQRDEEGPDGYLKCDACGKWVGGLLRQERMEGLGRNVGRDETVVGETWGLDRGFRMEGRVVGFFL